MCLLHRTRNTKLQSDENTCEKHPAKSSRIPYRETGVPSGRQTKSPALGTSCHPVAPHPSRRKFLSGQQQIPHFATQRVDYLIHSIKEHRDNKPPVHTHS